MHTFTFIRLSEGSPAVVPKSSTTLVSSDSDSSSCHSSPTSLSSSIFTYVVMCGQQFVCADDKEER